MTVRKIKETLEGEVICGEEFMDREVGTGCGCDLMSHVLSHIKHNHTLLMTGLTTPQVIFAADAVDINVVCFVRGKRPENDVIELARERGMVLLFTDLPMYESCGRLYKNGLRGCSEYEE
jgi:hypothetical protein